MTRDQVTPDDERLAARLRAIDPVRGLAPLAEQRIEEIMSKTTASEASGGTRSAHDLDPARRRRPGILAGMAAVAAAAAVVTAVLITQPSPGRTMSLTLPDPDGVGTLCAPIAPEFIAGSDVAFEGRVTGIEGSRVTLEVLRQYVGEPADTVVIPQ